LSREDTATTFLTGAVVGASIEDNRGAREGLLRKYMGVSWEDTATSFAGLALVRKEDGS